MGKKRNIAGVLKKVDVLEKELVRLKRDIIHNLMVTEKPEKFKSSLFGSVKSGKDRCNSQ